MRYIDCHTHAHFAAFADDYRDVIARAAAAHVRMITVGTQFDTSKRAIEVAHEFPETCFAAVGLHPIHTEKSYHDEKELGGGDAAQAFSSRGETFDLDAYAKLAVDPKVVAIGECGLDYYRLSEETKEKQKKVFEEHIRLSHELKKPLMIHCRAERDGNPAQRGGRNAFKDLIDLLSSHQSLLTDPPGVVHFFTGTVEDAHALLNLGFSFTFGGVLTFTHDYDEVVRYIPHDRILSETDAPYIAPVPYRGKRNEPSYIIEVVKRLAELKERTLEEMAAQIEENARRIFKIP